jgi:uncharacterized membrane protein
VTRSFPWLALVLLGAVLGLVFAGVSTYDFVQHLDRQVHSLHCSFIPGMSHGAGESGCQVAMMSPYSSVFRQHIWGGIPIALPAMSVFAFLACFTVDLLLTQRKHDRRATGFLLLAACLPLVMSLLMLTISLAKLGTTCKLCVVIYVSSALVFAGALLQFLRARRLGEAPVTSTGFLGAAFGLGVVFVVLPVLLYFALAPDHKRFIGTCDVLPHPDDPYKVMLDLDGRDRGVFAIEVLDPLCPACRAFEQRLQQSGLDEELHRHAILFPLDSTCNWMVTETTHPGACTISEAVLCAGPKAHDVIEWAFAEQEKITAAAKADPQAAARLVKERFPELAQCVGSADAKSKLNKSLRWSVANGIHVLTPQLFIKDVKLCDEDVDLGLDYTLSEMIERERDGTLKGAK